MTLKSFFFSLGLALTLSSVSYGQNIPLENIPTGMKHLLQRSLIDRARQVNDTPISMAVPLKQVNWDLVTQKYDPKILWEAFRLVRDTRFMADPDVPNFLRRISWMYPDNGCYSRAGLVGMLLKKNGYLRPAKVFIFGNISMKSPNSKTTISWLNHAAPAVRVGNEIYLFDIAMDPSKPVNLKDWLVNLGVMNQPPEKTRIAICSTYTYHATNSSCTKGDWREEKEMSLHNTLASWLPAERARLLELGRNPVKELGDEPPWAHKAR